MSSVIDFEVHILPPRFFGSDFRCAEDEPTFVKIHRHSEYPQVKPLLTLSALIQSMKRSGIDRCIIMGMPWREESLQDENNAYVAEVVRSHPDLFRGCFIPHCGDMERAARQISALDRDVFVGVKLLPSDQGVKIDSPYLEPLWKAMSVLDLFLIVHTDHSIQGDDGDTPFRFLRFLESHPELRVAAPHLGGLLCLYELLPRVAKVAKNVYYVSSVSATLDMVEFAAKVCPGRVMFGSDFPFNHCHDQASIVEGIRALDLSPEEIERVLGKTADEFLGVS